MTAETTIVCRLGPSAFGLAPGPSTAEVLATTQGSGVLQYSVQTQVRTGAWSLGGSSLTFSSAAVYNTASNTYFAAVQQAPSGSHQVLSWKEDGASGPLDRVAGRINLPKAVYAIYPTSSRPSVSDADSSGRRPADSQSDSVASTSGRDLDHEGVFVVFKDGTVALDDFYSNGKIWQSIGQEGRVEASSSHKGKLAVVTLDRDECYVLALYGIVEGKLRQIGSVLLKPPERASLASLSIRGQALSVLWSEGTLQTYYLFSSSNASFTLRQQTCRRLDGFESQQVPPEKAPLKAPKVPNGVKHSLATWKRKSAALTNGDTQSRPVVVTAPGSLVATVSWTGEGAAVGKKLRITVMDSMYGTARRMEEISAANFGDSAKAPLLQAIHLGSETKQLAVLAAGSIFVTGFEDAPPTLATLVGALSQCSTSSAAKAARSAFHAGEWAKLRPPVIKEVPTKRCSWLPAPDIAEKLDPVLLQTEFAVPLDPRDDGGAASAAADAEFERDMQAAYDKISSPASYATQEDAKQLLFSLFSRMPGQGRRSRLDMLAMDMLSLLVMRLTEHGYWREMNRVMYVQKLRSLANLSGWVPLLAEAGQHEHMATFLPVVSHLSAGDLQQTLQILMMRNGAEETAWQDHLRTAASQMIDLVEKQSQSHTSPAPEDLQNAVDTVAAVQRFSAQELILHPLVAMKIDDTVLLRALQGVTAQHAVRLARYLLRWLQSFSDLPASMHGNNFKSGAVLPPLQHVIQWLCRLLDAHLIGLAMFPKCAELAKKLQWAVRRHAAGLSSYAPLLGSIEHIHCKAPIPSHTGMLALYSVEFLDIGIET